MADTDAKPMTSGDIEAPPPNTDFQPAASLENAGVEFDAEQGGTGAGTSGGSDAGQQSSARQALKDGATKLSSQATDRIRAFAQDGQARAGGALDQLVQMLQDAASQVDDKLGNQYGDYARQAAGTVSGFADTVKNKDVDELFDEARGFIRKSPGVAIGAAAALGFVAARLVQSGLEADRASPTTDQS